jgi:hypothetical protein
MNIQVVKLVPLVCKTAPCSRVDDDQFSALPVFAKKSICDL